MQESPVDSQSEAQVTPELAAALKPQGGRRFCGKLVEALLVLVNKGPLGVELSWGTRSWHVFVACYGPHFPIGMGCSE